MTSQKFGLSVIDGLLCITSEMSGYSEPELITSHWPTTVKARDFYSFFDCTEADLATFSVRESMPGEYHVQPAKHWNFKLPLISLVNGGRTQAIKTDIRPYDPPKTRCRVEWDSGSWRKLTRKGWVRV
jgi:hypothetical protein